MNKKMGRVLFLFLILFLLVGGGVVSAQTPDGETPAVETVCDGQSGAAFGLCNAYCEAMDCDSGAPQASEKACNRVLDKFVQLTDEVPPCDAVCGNAISEPGEECDAGELNGFLSDEGEFTCNIDCTIAVPGPGSCGNGNVDGEEICDLGEQNGMEGSGCTSTCELDEGDPPPSPI